jgi:NADH-quinone oxidoreductase subunit L
MLIPLGVLSLGAVLAGFLFHHEFIERGRRAHFWEGSVAFNEHLMHAMHGVPTWVKWAPFGVMAPAWHRLAGLYPQSEIPAKVPAIPAAAHLPLQQVVFDELYNLIFVRPAFWLGRQVLEDRRHRDHRPLRPQWHRRWAVLQGSVRRGSSPVISTYALVMLLGLVAAISWAITQWCNWHERSEPILSLMLLVPLAGRA